MKQQAAIALIFLVFSANCTFGNTVCNVSGLGPNLETFTFQKCDGALSPAEAIDCVNRLAEEAEDMRVKSEKAIAQAECLCKALNEIAGGLGHYSRLNGTCTIKR
ncbi:hypothetical protein OOJ09_31795 [Mesorhizobium qingshengii]|uniref:Cysteine rich repeat-containing protein n=1 Tax=Mesorhizobium qingshengii TaxID=1165689 RepID=A0ABT4R4J0_9HYPH|nr:hypothetical protein [Mesorhizobium qingshengii]MCZ8548752.1 hypothetical protein [Mesorhizobium qingshengii]